MGEVARDVIMQAQCARRRFGRTGVKEETAQDIPLKRRRRFGGRSRTGKSHHKRSD